MVILSKYRAQMSATPSAMTAVAKGRDSLMAEIPNYCIFYIMLWILQCVFVTDN